ncbi:MAG: PEP-CTERM sorting domain-containing protein [Actinobacteria bacterium]|nr:PEP-CTERM sorting domain-containing protein [Actinomycetota bacterium]
MSSRVSIVAIVVGLVLTSSVLGSYTGTPVTSGLRWWLDAADPYNNGGTALPAEGNVIGQWYDKATGDGSQDPTTAYQNSPHWYSNSGAPVLRFDGTDDKMEVASSTASFNYLHDGTANTVFIVAKSDNAAYFLENNGALDSNPGTRFANVSTSGRYLTQVTNGSATSYIIYTGAGTWPLGNYEITSRRFVDSGTPSDGTDDVELIRDGSLIATADATAGFSSADANRNMVIGRLGGTYLDGDISEILAYDRALSDAELNQVGSYLGTKYGITWVPEPATMIVLAAGGLLALLGRRRRA